MRSYLAKAGVFEVERWLGSVCDKKLRQVRVGTRVRHGDHPTSVVLQRVADLVVELLLPDRGPAFALARRIARLDDEALDVSVEQATVVIIRRGECQKVVAGVGALLAKQLDFYVANVAVKGHGHFR